MTALIFINDKYHEAKKERCKGGSSICQVTVTKVTKPKDSLLILYSPFRHGL